MLKHSVVRLPRPCTECAPDAELSISATAHFWMSVSHGGNSVKTRIETPVQGISFQFRWGPPPRAAVPEMQQRLRALCKDKDDITDVRADPSTRMACALLDLPDVADGLTDEELGKAAVLTGAFNQDLRLSALKCLFRTGSEGSPVWSSWIREIRENPVAVRRLRQSSGTRISPGRLRLRRGIPPPDSRPNVCWRNTAVIGNTTPRLSAYSGRSRGNGHGGLGRPGWAWQQSSWCSRQLPRWLRGSGRPNRRRDTGMTD